MKKKNVHANSHTKTIQEGMNLEKNKKENKKTNNESILIMLPKEVC
jgi:hypothetical protein